MASPSTMTRSSADIATVDFTRPSPASAALARLVWRRRIAKVSRWLHIYGSMGSLAIVLFFAVTGLTLNHQDWFANQSITTDRHGTVNSTWVHGTDPAAVDKLHVVEYLRASAGVRGALADFRIDDTQCDLDFKGPGYQAAVIIDRATGRFDVTESRMGFAAVINDLHKGRDTGDGWRVVIDVAAGLLVCISLTGLMLLYFVHKYRLAGVILAGTGALASYLVYVVWVP